MTASASLNLVPDDHDGFKWLDDIACADLELDAFFVAAGHTIAPDTIETCRRCPVRRECVIYVYNRGLSSGYMAGLSPSQRDKMTLEEALEYIEQDTPTEDA